MTLLVSADSIGVTIDRQTLLSPTSFQVDTGAALAVLGPNGAGKTTLLRVVSGRLRASSGAIAVAGMTPKEMAAIPPISSRLPGC